MPIDEDEWWKCSGCGYHIDDLSRCPRCGEDAWPVERKSYGWVSWLLAIILVVLFSLSGCEFSCHVGG